MTASRTFARVIVAAASLSALASPLLAHAATMAHHHGKTGAAAQQSKAAKK